MNNRQPGRRRGRNTNSNNNNRNQGNRGGVDRDNRIDNRARGNAAQMLEKYKKMAQDAQVNGDRVNAEYYHQFADHYFRVNADTQARREEQRQARDEQRGHNNDRNDNRHDGDEQEDGDNQDRSPRARQQNDRRPRANDQRGEDQIEETTASGESDKAEVAVEEKKPVRARRPRKPAASAPETKTSEINGESNGFDVSILPPAIAIQPDDNDGGDEDENTRVADASVVDDAEPKKKPVVRKRRTVKAKVAEGDDAAA